MSFPYNYKFLPSPSEMFESLKHNEIKKIEGFGRMYIIVRKYPEDFQLCDALSDHFTEPHRMKATQLPSRNKSPIDLFNSWSTEFKSKFTPQQLRDELYFKSGMANGFNPCISISLIQTFKLESVFDPCMGWGDRLIGALASGMIKRYVGFDLNATLFESYDKIYSMWGSGTEFQCFNMPIETMTNEVQGKFDGIITSPPFYDLEIYPTNDILTSTQDVAKFKQMFGSEEEWYVKFYYLMLEKCLSVLKSKGFLCFYIEPSMVQKTHSYLKSSCNYVGKIGFYQSAGGKMNERKIRDTHIWQLL